MFLFEGIRTSTTTGTGGVVFQLKHMIYDVCVLILIYIFTGMIFQRAINIMHNYGTLSVVQVLAIFTLLLIVSLMITYVIIKNLIFPIIETYSQYSTNDWVNNRVDVNELLDRFEPDLTITFENIILPLFIVAVTAGVSILTGSNIMACIYGNTSIFIVIINICTVIFDGILILSIFPNIAVSIQLRNVERIYNLSYDNLRRST